MVPELIVPNVMVEYAGELHFRASIFYGISTTDKQKLASGKATSSIQGALASLLDVSMQLLAHLPKVIKSANLEDSSPTVLQYTLPGGGSYYSDRPLTSPIVPEVDTWWSGNDDIMLGRVMESSNVMLNHYCFPKYDNNNPGANGGISAVQTHGQAPGGDKQRDREAGSMHSPTPTRAHGANDDFFGQHVRSNGACDQQVPFNQPHPTSQAPLNNGYVSHAGNNGHVGPNGNYGNGSAPPAYKRPDPLGLGYGHNAQYGTMGNNVQPAAGQGNDYVQGGVSSDYLQPISDHGSDDEFYRDPTGNGHGHHITDVDPQTYMSDSTFYGGMNGGVFHGGMAIPGGPPVLPGLHLANPPHGNFGPGVQYFFQPANGNFGPGNQHIAQPGHPNFVPSGQHFPPPASFAPVGQHGGHPGHANWVTGPQHGTIAAQANIAPANLAPANLAPVNLAPATQGVADLGHASNGPAAQNGGYAGHASYGSAPENVAYPSETTCATGPQSSPSLAPARTFIPDLPPVHENDVIMESDFEHPTAQDGEGGSRVSPPGLEMEGFYE